MNDDAQFPPLADINIQQLIEQLAIIFGGTTIAPGLARMDNSMLVGIMRGDQLATGLELIRWCGDYRRAVEFVRNPAQDSRVWSIMLTDSPLIQARELPETGAPASSPAQDSRGGMAYLYNHHMAMNALIHNAGLFRVLVIRLKPPAWEQLLTDRPDYVQRFIDADTPLLYGFHWDEKLQALFSQLFAGDLLPQQQQPQSDAHSNQHSEQQTPWQLLVSALGVCDHIFAKLGRRSMDADIALRAEDARRIYQAQQLLIGDFQRPPSIDAVGKQLGFGRDKFRKLFQQVFGSTPFQYFQHQRMEEARRLIQAENVSAMEAGYRVGYSHLGHFAKAYKKQFGVLPKDSRL